MKALGPQEILKTNLPALICLLAVLGELHAPAAQNVEFPGNAAAPEAPLCLWYRQPSAKWEEALPLGNGHIGAMVFGSVPTERIQFTEHTVWTGQPHDYARPGAAKALPEMRRLLFAGRTLELRGLEKQKEAARLALLTYRAARNFRNICVPSANVCAG